MELLAFINAGDPSGERLRGVIADVRGLKTEFLEDAALFSGALKRLRYPGAVLFHAWTPEDFEFALSAGDLLREVRLILVLPDRKKSTVDRGYDLCPRYVAFSGGDFSDIHAVLQHMAGTSDGQHFDRGYR